MAANDDERAAIAVNRLHRTYQKRGHWFRSKETIVAVDEISFMVPTGAIFGLLGPNGAGKTTTIKMLSTLLVPTSGTATVGGFDVVRDERAVRRQLGVVLGGDRGLYAQLSARDNLTYFGQLYGMTGASIKRRVEEMLDLVNLRDRADERVEGFSRGMKQRLHLAKALLHDPPILILDEPTIGLDPAAAVDLRRAIAALPPRHSVLLTTHDMHEADQLCREIAIVDHGKIVGQGTPAALKARVAGERRVVIAAHAALNGRALDVASRLNQLVGVQGIEHETEATGETVWTLRCADTAVTLDRALALLRHESCPVQRVTVVEPTLEDAFLAITARRLT
jgi:ABC-2 type transport system ATP-binding protein